MGFLSGMTAGLYRYTVDGRRLFYLRLPAPTSMRPAYLVPDSEIQPFEHRMRRLLGAFFIVGIPVMAIVASMLSKDEVSDTLLDPKLWMPGVLLLLVYYAAFRVWVLRGLPRVAVKGHELVPIDKRARERDRVKAMGEGTIITLLIVGVLLIAVQMIALIQGDYWWALAGTLMFGAAEIQLARQLYILRRM